MFSALFFIEVSLFAFFFVDWRGVDLFICIIEAIFRGLLLTYIAN